MNIKYIAAAGAITALLAATPVFADTDLGAHADANVHGAGLHLGQLVGFHLGQVLRADIGSDLDTDADTDATSTEAHKHPHMSANDLSWQSYVAGGVVSSIDSAGIHLAPAGAHASTTIAIGPNTVIRAIGAGTTSDAITVGSKILAFGSTTATSTSGSTFNASVILVLEHGFAHVMHWLHI